MLILPTETSGAQCGSWGFEHRHHDDLTGDFSVAQSRLRGGNVLECRIVDAFYETISKRVQGGPERLNFITNRDMFLNGGIDRPIINERTARGSGKSLGRSIIMSRPKFGDLAQTTGDR